MINLPIDPLAPIVGKLHLEYEEQADCAEMLERRFASYLSPQTDPDLEFAYDHDRFYFEGFSALSAVQSSASGIPRMKSNLPEVMNFIVRVYHPSLYGSFVDNDTFQVERDARAEAMRLTRRILGRWEKAFRADKSLRRAVEAVNVLDWEYGDADRLGNLRMSGTGDSVLWVARLTAQIRP